MCEFDNKKVVVCGGASGIGLSSAKLFHKNGANVLIFDKIPICCIDAEGDNNLKKIPFVKIDLTRKNAVKKIQSSIEQFLGGVDILVNSVGVQTYGTLEDTSSATWDETINTNLYSIIKTCKVCIPYLLKSKSGAIVNVSSIQAQRCRPRSCAYVTSKGALSAFTRAMAVDYAAQGIRVNAIEPAAIDTPLLQNTENKKGLSEEGYRTLAYNHPMKRIGIPQEVAEAVAFLASERASFITGISLLVDGGVSASAFSS